MDTLWLGFLYVCTSAIVLGTLKEDLGEIFQTNKFLQMVFGVCSIRMFYIFSLL